MAKVVQENTCSKKLIIQPGIGELPEYAPDSKAIFHFRTTKKVKGDEEIIDDSRTLNQPMEMLIGKKFKLQIWEDCIKTMKVGEVAKIRCSKDLVPCYAFVSRQYRRFVKTKGHADEDFVDENASSACCGMALKGSVGHKDLDELLKDPCQLEFTIELLEVKKKEEYEKEIWQMSEKEQLYTIPKLKEKGNEYYRLGDYEEAARLYSKGLGIIENLMLREKPGEKEWVDLDEMRLPFYLNLSQCKLNTKEYYQALENCNKALEKDANNVKGLFRRAIANMNTFNFVQAREDFLKVQQLNSNLTLSIDSYLKELKKMEGISYQKEKSMFAGKLFI